jgi:hypothetical protein
VDNRKEVSQEQKGNNTENEPEADKKFLANTHLKPPRSAFLSLIHDAGRADLSRFSVEATTKNQSLGKTAVLDTTILLARESLAR